MKWAVRGSASSDRNFGRDDAWIAEQTWISSNCQILSMLSFVVDVVLGILDGNLKIDLAALYIQVESELGVVEASDGNTSWFGTMETDLVVVLKSRARAFYLTQRAPLGRAGLFLVSCAQLEALASVCSLFIWILSDSLDAS